MSLGFSTTSESPLSALPTSAGGAVTHATSGDLVGPGSTISTTAVVYDTSVSANVHVGSTISATETVAAGSNRVLVAFIGNSGLTPPSVSGVAYTLGSGGTWTLFGSILNGLSEIEVWYSVAPSVGTVTVQATFASAIASGDAEIALYSLNNVDQYTPLQNLTTSTTTGLSVTSGSGNIVLAMIATSGAITGFTPTEDGFDAWNQYWFYGQQAVAGTASWSWTSGGLNTAIGVDVKRSVASRTRVHDTSGALTGPGSLVTGAAGSPATHETALVSFDFDGAATVLETIDARWTVGTAGDLKTNGSGQLECFAGSNIYNERKAFFVNGQGNAQKAQVTYKANANAGASGEYIHLAINGSTSNRGYDIQQRATGGVNLVKNGSFIVAAGDGYVADTSIQDIVYSIENDGIGNIKVYRDGTLLISHNDTASPLTGGNPGLSFYSSGTASWVKADDFIDFSPPTVNLVGQGSLVSGTSSRFRTHATSGALVGPGSAITGSSNRTRVHDASVAVVFGNTAAMTGDYLTSVDRSLFSKFTLSTAATITKLTARYGFSGSGSVSGNNAKGVIYADSAGSPGALQATSASVTIPGGDNQLVDFPLSVSLPAGDYWLGVVDNFYQARLGFTTGSGSVRKESLTYASPANPMGTPTDATIACTFCIYATYLVPLTGQGSVITGSADRTATGGPVTHATVGDLVGPGSLVTGTAARFRAMASTGALVGQGSTITGTAARFRAMTSTGALVGQGSTITGTSVHNITHPTSGTLIGPGSTVTGTAARFRAHATSGDLIGQGSLVTGTAAHIAIHATTGTLVGAGAVITGSAARAAPGPVTHATSGDLAGQGSLVTGAAVHIAIHTSTGALTGPGSLVTGTAARFRGHVTSGDLTGQGSLVTGSAAHIAIHTTTGVLVGQGSTITGTAARFRAMASTGALVGQGSLVTGAAVHIAIHTSTGALVGQGSIIEGIAARFRAHTTSGTLTGQLGSVTGAATRFRAHATSGTLTGQLGSVTGAANRFRSFASSGNLVGAGSLISGVSFHSNLHGTTGTLVGSGSILSGSSTRFRVFSTSGDLVGPGAVLIGQAIHPLPITDYSGQIFVLNGITNYYYQNVLADSYATSAKQEVQYYYRSAPISIFVTE